MPDRATRAATAVLMGGGLALAGALVGLLLAPALPATGARGGIVAVDPALATRSPREAIDLIFVPDRSYWQALPGQDLDALQKDLAAFVDGGFRRNSAIDANVDLINFWVAGTAVSVGGAAYGGMCPIVQLPHGSQDWWRRIIAQADVVMVVHDRGQLRNCRWGKLATTWRRNAAVAVHEFGHAAFNLPDEYSGSGCYFESPPVLYEQQLSTAAGVGCEDDPMQLAWARDCKELWALTSEACGGNRTFWRSEDHAMDVMAIAPEHYVPQFGPADWSVIEAKLRSFARATVATPSAWPDDGPAAGVEPMPTVVPYPYP